VPPVISPETAVKAVIVHEHRSKKAKEPWTAEVGKGGEPPANNKAHSLYKK
jgi:hypothetical protein